MAALKMGVELKMAGRYVSEQQRRVAKQRELLSTLRSAARPTDVAQRVLNDMLSLLMALEKHLEFLRARSQ